MNAGRLNRKITIQTLSESTYNSYGERTKSWSDFAAGIWARVEPLRETEYFQAQQFQSKIETKFTIRYVTGIKPKMKVVYGGVDYNIESVINPNESNREISMLCSRITT